MMKAVATLLLLGAATSCVIETRHPNDHPSSGVRRPTPVRDRWEEPESQVWPLPLWLDEVARRNGISVRYDPSDVARGEVVSPRPGPFDSDDQTRAALDDVLGRFGLRAVEEKPHVFRVKRGPRILVR